MKPKFSLSRRIDLCVLLLLVTLGGAATCWLLWPIAEGYWNDLDARRNETASTSDIPNLVTDLGNISVPDATRAMEQLVSLGGAAVPALATALGDSDPAVRWRAALILGRIGANAQSAIPQLLIAARDPDTRVRADAIWTIGRIGADPSECFRRSNQH